MVRRMEMEVETMKIAVPYGHTQQIAVLPAEVQCTWARLNPAKPDRSCEEEIRAALEIPLGVVDWDKLCSAKTVAIAVSDITRPVPSRSIIQQLLTWLESMRIGSQKIVIIVGGGLHRPASKQEIEEILGRDLINRVHKVLSHDADDEAELAYLGATKLGTPVYVNKHFAAADYKIVTGMIDAHQFMGFTGGVKGAVIGLGGRPTITANHARLFLANADLGHLEDNPVRQDLEEAGQMIGVDFLVNVVLNENKEVINAVAGHPKTAHRAGVTVASQIFGIGVPQADIVITSPGGFPKDINVYQAQKALTPAALVVRPGGTVILVAECPEGSGETSFEQEMAKYENPTQVMEGFLSREFVIGPHKAYLWARTLAKAKIILVSDKVSPDLARILMVELHSNLQLALDDVLLSYHDPVVAILPNASSVVPLRLDEPFE